LIATAMACCQFALKLASTAGKRDGLYWTADPAKGEEASPFGPLIAESSRRTASRATRRATPYRGYHFRILTRQGEACPGRRLQLRDQWPHDRRLRHGGLPR
jgi:hypothetical protein